MVRLAPILLLAAGMPKDAQGYKLVVLGDIHGDMDYLRAMLEYNGVLDSSGAWLDPSTCVTLSAILHVWSTRPFLRPN